MKYRGSLMRGKLILILLFASMALLLAACGSGDATEAAPDTDSSSEEASEEATLPPAEDEDVELDAPDANELYDLSVTGGQEIFEMFCSKCHGLTGVGDGPSAGSLHITGNVALTALEDKTDEELMETITFGKGVDMPAWGLILSTEQREAVLAYVRTLGTE